MKWISAAAFAAVMLCACSKTETTTSSETSATTSSETSTAATATTDTTATIVPVPTETMTTNPASGTSSTSSTRGTSTTPPSTSGTTSTTSTSSTAPTGSTSTTQSENNNTTTDTMMSSGVDLVADGAATFKAKGCAGCHGATGAGDTAIGKKNNIRDFHSADVQKQSDDELARILKEGKGSVSKMAHKSKNLTDLQVKSLIAYIRTLK